MLINFLSSAVSWQEVKDFWNIDVNNTAHIIQYNIQPGDGRALLFYNNGQYIMKKMTWGIPSSIQQSELLISNARREGIFSQNTFRFNIRNRRAVLPIDSFYNVQTSPTGGVSAYRVVPEIRQPLFVAVIYDDAKNAFAIINQPAGPEIRDITEREPVLITTKEDLSTWLTTENISVIDRMIHTEHRIKWNFHSITRDIVNNINSPLLHKALHKNLTLFD